MTDSSPMVQRILAAVAEHENARVEGLPLLRDQVPSTTMDKLTTEWDTQTEPLEFSYLWYTITVSSNGEVSVTP